MVNEYSVSRTSVKEALRKLVEAGIAELVPHRGVMVRKISLSELADYYTVMARLESLAIRFVAENHDSKMIEELQEILEQDKQAVSAGNYVQHRKKLLEFRHKIAEFSGNGPLCEIIKRIHTITSINSRPFEYAMQSAIENHSIMLNAIINSDADLAEATMENAIKGGLEFLRNNIVNSNNQ
ncbi:FCD domain-containing protein [Bacillus sp. B15-48]|nr:FCD domain-containing protein [Bacillus sp. B15-48]